MRNVRKEMKMLDMIKDYINDHGYSPTVQRYLNMLEMERYIAKTNSSSKTIRILK